MSEHIVGVDVGGSHVAAGMIDDQATTVVASSFSRAVLGPSIGAEDFITALTGVIRRALEGRDVHDLTAIGVAMPGPFDYPNGVSRIHGLGKLGRLFGLDIRATVRSRLDLGPGTRVRFLNDAVCAVLGAYRRQHREDARFLGVTLGTGFGSAFLMDGIPVEDGPGVPASGFLYDAPYEGGRANDAFCTRWLLEDYATRSGQRLPDARELAKRADSDETARNTFVRFGQRLATFLARHIRGFDAGAVLIGGGIAGARRWFAPAFTATLETHGLHPEVLFMKRHEPAAIVGAAAGARALPDPRRDASDESTWRRTTQKLAPLHKPPVHRGEYDIYPAFPLPVGQIRSGLEALAEALSEESRVVIDGYVGVFWDPFRERLDEALRRRGVHVRWYAIEAASKSEQEILEATAPWMGEEDSIFGKRHPGRLEECFDRDRLERIRPDGSPGLDILIGGGAALAGWKGCLVYVDLPKNELQYRARAGRVRNLGLGEPLPPREAYKRFYFVDWVLLDRHKRGLVDRIDWIVDEQRRDTIAFLRGDDLRDALARMARSYFRVRPWFEPGPWGGTWLRDRIAALPGDVPNYAWSFELIVPENGLLFESGGLLLECSFDHLMFREAERVLGPAHRHFGHAFPIRFDFLDTFDGGNLSVQCHPRPRYMRDAFGERFTQDECYYILDARPDARVYLGFQDHVDPTAFRRTLEASRREAKPVDIDRFVQSHRSKKHDFFLIPSGTVHASGRDNLVLEISSTPYIFTFKMYDWLRLDLEGRPRPIHIQHAFSNLVFDRRGERVRDELISRPEVLHDGDGTRIEHLPTHARHFYDVLRYTFSDAVEVETRGRCLVCMLVEGQTVALETRHGEPTRFSYAETFVIPAAAESFRLINESGTDGAAKVVMAFVKPEVDLGGEGEPA